MKTLLTNGFQHNRNLLFILICVLLLTCQLLPQQNLFSSKDSPDPFSELTSGAVPGNGGYEPAASSAQAFIGTKNLERFGCVVASAGDVNGDGFLDFIVGASGNTNSTGVAYVFYGGLVMNTVPDVILLGETVNNYFGASIAGAGDINGDGYDDVLVGAYGAGGNSGKVSLFYGGSMMDNAADLYFNGEGVNNFFGTSVAGAGDINADGFDDFIIGANGANSGNGRVYVYYGGLNISGTADLVLNGTAGSYFGSTVEGVGDVDNDGFADIAVGEWPWSGNTGRVLIYFGGSPMNATYDSEMQGPEPGAKFGKSIAGGRDVNGDGYVDVAIGSWGVLSGVGRVNLYYGGWAMDGNSDREFYGHSISDFGYSVALGDVNGDGFGDLIVGASKGRGQVFIYHGGRNMDAIVDGAIVGEEGETFFGTSVANARDMNNDGYEDLLVGAFGYSLYRGKVYLYRNTPSGSDVPDYYLRIAAGAQWWGSVVASAGDVNGDGYNDLLVASMSYNSNRGAVNLYFGGAAFDTIPDVTFTGEYGGNYFGRSVAGAGDVNGDGYADIIVGAPRYQAWVNGQYTYVGRTYIFYGGLGLDGTPDVIMQGTTVNENFGWSVSSAGDMDGDGYSEVIVGAPNYVYINYSSDTIPNAGRITIYRGGAVMDSIEDNSMTHGGADYYVGHSVAAAGDVNGDGYSDVLVGSFRYKNEADVVVGAVWLIYGGRIITTWPDLYLYGPEYNSQFGLSVCSAGDVNGDGFSDFVVGSYRKGYLYLGGAIVDTSKRVIFDQMLYNMGNFYYGTNIAGAGDVNGDGFSDIVYGWPVENSGNGRTFVLYGGASMDYTPDLTFNAVYSASYSGSSVACAGDINNDGLSDIVVGARGNNGISVNGGGAMIYLSSAASVYPRIVSVKDVPGDQGGKVNITFFKSGYDLPGSNKVTFYRVERSVASSTGALAWNLLETVTAVNNLYYCYEAATQSDSSSFIYRVTAVTNNNRESWSSNLVTGMSYDNLAPASVRLFRGYLESGRVVLHWKENTEEDLFGYVIYRGNSSHIDPDSTTPIAVVNDTTFSEEVSQSGAWYYFIRARDIHGNYGPLSSASDGPLPVELISFTAKSRGNEVQLKWKTATESNLYCFEVEKKIVGGNDWLRSGEVPACGNSNSEKNYFFRDVNRITGDYEYRLKLIYSDGASAFSNIIGVTIDSPQDFQLGQNYPNPFNPSTTIEYQVPVKSMINLRLFDITGNEIMTVFEGEKEAGYYKEMIEGTGLASGVYLFRLQAQGVVLTKKLMLVR